MKLKRRAFVVGGAHTKFIGKFHPDFIWKGHPDFGKRQNPALEDYVKNAALGALESAKVPAEAIERGVVGNFCGECFSKQGHLGAVLAGAHPAFNRKPFSRVEGACASGGLAVLWGIDSIQAGCDCVLAVGAEVQTSVSAKDGADYLARAAHYASQFSIDPFPFPCLFGRRTKAYMQKYGLTWDDIAKVVVKAYSNANRNPFAHMTRKKMAFEDARNASDKNPLFLTNPDYKDYLRVNDCSQVSDGGSAVILASEDGLKKLGKSRADVVEICSYGYAAGSIFEMPEPTRLDITRAAVKTAFEDAGIGPDRIQVAEVHDCFAINEILMYEALGLAEEGKGAKLLSESATNLDGRIPVNTGGGLIAFGHPVGATGVKQVIEIYRQMKGLCGEYQIPKKPEIGVTANMGGDDRTSVAIIFRA